MSSTQTQKLVDEHFARVAPQWHELYSQNDVFAVIHQYRRDVALGLIQKQNLSGGCPILDIGCGAGVLTVELARRGYRVNAIDAVPAMVALTKKNAVEAGISDHVSAETGDAHNLAFKSAAFDCVVAMGITPFLHSLPEALKEISRVIKSGGLLVINSDNRWRLTRVLDPLLSPLTAWLRKSLKRILALLRLREPKQEPRLVHMYSNREFISLLRDAGLEVMEARAIGFGPFSFCERRLFSDRMGVKIHWLLQSWAERFSVLRAVGSQTIVLAQKRPLVSGR